MPACPHIPETNRIVITPARQGATIRTEYDAIDPRRMLTQRLNMTTTSDIPETNRSVCTPARQGATIRTEYDAIDRICMPHQRPNMSASPDIPYADGAI